MARRQATVEGVKGSPGRRREALPLSARAAGAAGPAALAPTSVLRPPSRVASRRSFLPLYLNWMASSSAARYRSNARRNGLRSVVVSMAPARSSGQTRTTGLATTRLTSSGPKARLSVERASQSPRTKTVPDGTTCQPKIGGVTGA